MSKSGKMTWISIGQGARFGGCHRCIEGNVYQIGHIVACRPGEVGFASLRVDIVCQKQNRSTFEEDLLIRVGRILREFSLTQVSGKRNLPSNLDAWKVSKRLTTYTLKFC